jgi:hypothetical protein
LQQVHIRCRKQVLALVLEHKPQGHCKQPCESAGGSADLLALQQVHMRCRRRVLGLELVHSTKQHHHCNPYCGQKYQPKR